MLAISLGHVVERAAGDIELTEAQGGGGEIQVRIEVVWQHARDLRAPGDGFGSMLLLGRVGQDVKCGDRIRMEPEHLLCGDRGALEVVLLHQLVRALHEA